MILNIIIFALIAGLLYVRYVPVRGVPCVEHVSEKNLQNALILDLRGYSEAKNNPIHGAYNLPLAYLKRHYQTIEKRDIVVVASDSVCKNLGTRFLKRKGFNVIGYSFTSHYDKCMNLSFDR